jgi:tetratricopeptide (TPR) repeat protein
MRLSRTAYYLRALAWHRKGDARRAIRDFDKAAELDPANAAVYRTNREKASHDAHVVPPAPSAGPKNSTAAPSKGLTGFFKRLAQYYAEFLSTDFKKQRLPRRRLQTADAQGRLVGIPLRKYPGRLVIEAGGKGQPSYAASHRSDLAYADRG